LKTRTRVFHIHKLAVHTDNTSTDTDTDTDTDRHRQTQTDTRTHAQTHRHTDTHTLQAKDDMWTYKYSQELLHELEQLTAGVCNHSFRVYFGFVCLSFLFRCLVCVLVVYAPIINIQSTHTSGTCKLVQASFSPTVQAVCP